MPTLSQVIAAILLALILVLAVIFGWHLLSALWSFVGTLVSTVIQALAWLIQMAVTIAMGALVICSTLLIALGMLALVWMAYQRALESVSRWVRSFSEDGKSAATDATALAILAGIIGALAYLTTNDFLKSNELSLPKALTLSSIALILLKMALYIDSSNIRRAVWPLLGLVYLAPLVFGYYTFEEECSKEDGVRAVVECMIDLKPKDNLKVSPMQVAGHALIFVLGALAMLFPFSLATWRRFAGRKSDLACSSSPRVEPNPSYMDSPHKARD